MEKVTYPAIVAHAANDYAMDIDVVQKVYDKYGSTNRFYEELESILRQRSK